MNDKQKITEAKAELDTLLNVVEETQKLINREFLDIEDRIRYIKNELEKEDES